MRELARRAWRSVGGVACGVILCLTTATLPAQAASTGGTVTARDKATAAADAMMGFYDEETGRWDPQGPWWQSGNALQALLDYMIKTGSRTYLPQAENTIEI